MPRVGDPVSIKPFWQTKDNKTVHLYQGNVVQVLKRLPPKSVHMIVTSPPYWGLRNYGTGRWSGGDPNCDHVEKTAADAHKSSTLRSKKVGHPVTNAAYQSKVKQYKSLCIKCGAKRIDQQLGSETEPDCWIAGLEKCGECFVCHMVEVFRGLWRVLRDDGTVWLNIGDTYGGITKKADETWDGYDGLYTRKIKQHTSNGQHGLDMPKSNLDDGNLVGTPWRLILALQNEGWILRQEIIWFKPSPMPESVRNRCTKSHEYIFLLSKSPRYFYDMDAIREKTVTRSTSPDEYEKMTGDAGKQLYPTKDNTDFPNGAKQGKKHGAAPPEGKNKRSVWRIKDHKELLEWLANRAPELLDEFLSEHENKLDVWRVSSKRYKGSHFATFPPKLVEPCILAGTSGRGCCTHCGAPWRRVTLRHQLKRDRPNDYVKRTGEEGTGNSCANSVAGVESKTLGWYPTCGCDGLEDLPKYPAAGKDLSTNHDGNGDHFRDKDDDDDDRLSGLHSRPEKLREWLEKVKPLLEIAESIETVPCTVLDPFIGSGTTCAVSLLHGRRSWGIDLNEDYLKKQAIERIKGAILSMADQSMWDLVLEPYEKLDLFDNPEPIAE